MKATLPTSFDRFLFHKGRLFQSYHTFGAHICVENELSGVRFTLWAPHARQVSVIGDFNDWNSSGFELKKMNEEGIWTNFFPELAELDCYKYEILTSNGSILHKSDPYAFYSEIRPNTASIIYDLKGYDWKDNHWLAKRQFNKKKQKPMFIYEVHLGTWKKKPDGSFYTYKELADELVNYVKEHGFTHIELLPIYEHPFDRSWGYQGTGYYSVTSRYGTPHDFMAFVDKCHQEGIGVILDWVPGHFCKDAHGLFLFDGEPLYEYENGYVRENDVWGTANFDLGKSEVQSFLISNAVFWMDYFHIDGFRVDAVANMLFWDMHGDGNIYPNEYAVEFLQNLNQTIKHFDESVLVIAEDSTDWSNVTKPINEGGLGFTHKWNMGWMNDVLEYMQKESDERDKWHHLMTFSMIYAYSEKFILPFSHDEVVHGKRSLLNKMPGSYEEKFAQLRLLLGFMTAHPGEKLLFMGSEFGQFDEWKDLDDLDWKLLNYGMHSAMHEYSKAVLELYRNEPAFWECDDIQDGFEWIEPNNAHQKILLFIRKGKVDDDSLIVICNFSSQQYDNYKIGVPIDGTYCELFSSDIDIYGGSGMRNKRYISSHSTPYHRQPYQLEICIPPYAFVVFKRIRRERHNAYAQ
ncbi:1,4-alpha-glucan branching enzyme [Bacillus solimangrovi]|uniref:1,4-alpha-glucan branching enzyme GlgB n=1 Tax=Bacillus solimangrovi TaxID=1305675 RepID=A0A1E5LGC8_9BACI|nr:1,4-alpha-glucan branching enzyme [Bacillus solimangrovi]OEH93137.1 1,4-alpha-glucan branching enzyme [Bacillus solimangrovi]